jgi:hypothetical protein
MNFAKDSEMIEPVDIIEIKFGEETEALAQLILSDISDEKLETVDVRREIAEAVDLASEPTTTMVVIVGLSIDIIVSCISRYLENRRQNTSAIMLLRAYSSSPECGEAMVRLQLKHADLIRYSPLPAPSIGNLLKPPGSVKD